MVESSSQGETRALTPSEAADYRARFRAKAKESVYFLGKAVLGFTDATMRTHYPMCQFVERPSRRKLALAPRGTFKSSFLTIADIIRRIILDPNVRILLVSASETNACHFLGLIQEHFLKNALFRWLFPEIIPDFTKIKRWNQSEMLVPRTGQFPEATVEAIGVGGTVVSRHYDVIKNDDLVDEKIAQSATEMRRVLDWYKAEESLLANPKTGVIHTVGTRWAYHDVYGWMLKHEAGLDVYQVSAVQPDGTAFFPERLDLDELDRIRAKQGSWLFNCLYQNRPFDPDATSFKEEWLRYYDLVGDQCVPRLGAPVPIANLRRTMRVDPAISESSKAARTAILVDGVAPDGRKYLLDVWAKRCQPKEMFDAMFQLYDRWDCEAVGIESVAYQRSLQFFLAEEASRRDRWLNVIELRPDSRKSKEARIRSTQPYFERGEIWVREEQTFFLDEYREFPVGTTDDVLDVFAYGPVMWSPPLEEEESSDVETGWMFESQFGGRSETTGY